MVSNLLLFCLICCCNIPYGSCSEDNQGTEFIIAFSENFKKNSDSENSEPWYPLELFILPVGNDPIDVNITAPKSSAIPLSKSLMVNNGNPTKIEVDYGLQMHGNEQAPKGIHIQASGAIVLVAVNRQLYTSDGYLALPVPRLGKEHYVVTYFPDDFCQFVIVATEDGTTVDILLSDNTDAKPIALSSVTYNPGDLIQVSMEKFDAVQIQSDGDLTGSYISSDKPVAVLSGNRRTKIGTGLSSDHLVEQIISIDKWGKQFNVVPIPSRTVGDYYKVVTSSDSTSVTVSCRKGSDSFNAATSLPKAGDFDSLHIAPGQYCSFISDQKIMLVQLVLSQTSNTDKHDPTMILIAPVEQYQSQFTFTTPRLTSGSYVNYFMFVVRDSAKVGLRLDGNPFPSGTVYESIPGTDQVGGYIHVTDGYHTVNHVTPDELFSAVIYGRAKYESYGIPAGIRLSSICYETPSVLSDGIDNDCDGLVDEESCLPENNNADDDGDGRSDEDCGILPPVDGNWTNWEVWSGCSMTCNPYQDPALVVMGTRTRSRTCTNPAPKFGGDDCVGDLSETEQCQNNIACLGDIMTGATCGAGDAHSSGTPNLTFGFCEAVNGNWGIWGDLTDCLHFRFRSCDDPAPSGGGRDCAGMGNDSKPCLTTIPPVTITTIQSIPTASSCVCSETTTTTTSVAPPTRPPPPPIDITEVLKQLKLELRKDKKSLSMYKRSLTSAPDGRRSSALLGGCIGSILVVIVLVFLIMDMDKMYRFWVGNRAATYRIQ